MARQKGCTKTGGRKKGSLNKKTQELQDILKKADINVPERIIELLPTVDPDKQIDTLLKLMSYLYPKRKPVEHIHMKLEGERELLQPRVIISIPSNGREANEN
jgi:hypothetical protein